MEIIGVEQALLFLFNCKQKNLAIFSNHLRNNSTTSIQEAYAIDF